jgi:hypothetical protein
VVYVTALDLNGLSTEPPKVRKAFKCTCAFQVRDNVSITIHVWQLVPKTIWEQLWNNIKENIKSPNGIDE